ncbi:MAG: DUF1549 domain-containing protein, partial [Verrucomicrobiae bacterium]|nr:DUF1549 domain-containing protein [Verrucomicrobiae bacterium]
MSRRLLATVGLGLLLGGSLVSPVVAAESGLWSLQPVKAVDPPEVGDQEWPRSEIDRFLLAIWERDGLRPLGDAAPEVLVRRLYFNLIGLPPTPEQIDDFVSNPDVETLVDELLDSPRFGEKWARHWLDLARYAESNGRDRNVVFAHAWRYRDWVVEALNRDLPYNEFVREQIAGDLLPGAGDSQIVATGFLTLGAKAFQEMDREKFLLDLVDEQIDVTTRSVLGLTVACARCHDHKFDPIPQADYYALAGIFLSSDTLHGPGPLYYQDHQHDVDVVAIGPEKAALDEGIRQWRAEILQRNNRAMELRSAGYRIRRQVTGTLREKGLQKPEEDPELLALNDKADVMYEEAKTLLVERDALFDQSPPAPGYAMAMQESKMPEDCHVRVRGVHTDCGDVIPRGRLTIPGMPALDEIGGGESGRRQLADWLVSEKNPLTARVMVNRVWYQLFGRGLVRTVDNFGVTGEAPTHPELLDFLATQFVREDQWSVKRLVKRILLTRTWQLASSDESGEATRDRRGPREGDEATRNGHGSGVDPGNSLYWRANLRRLEVESFRDAVLQISGQLDLSPPAEGSLLAETFLGKEYGSASSDRVNFDKEIAAYRHRTLYLPIVRNELPEILKQFDFA